jgi:hypothetical protein
MKLYARENQTDSDQIELYEIWKGQKLIFAVVCSDAFDSDIQEALIENCNFDLELELKIK